MQQYLRVLSDVLEFGIDSSDRTGVGKRSLSGICMKYDLSKGFPAVTTKSLAFKAVTGELIGFINAVDNYHDFNKLKCKVWDANGEADYWLNNPNHTGESGYLGRIYGVQWSKWKGYKEVTYDQLSNSKLKQYLDDANYEEVANDPDRKVVVYRRTVDQLDNVINSIKNDPNSRRHIVSAWNCEDLDKGALPPCHVMFQFHVIGDSLDLTMYQRSADLFLGSPFNIASYSLLLHMVAAETGYKPGKFNYMIGDAHIYHNHFDQVKEQITRIPGELPTLKMNVKPSIYDYEVDDFALENYVHQGKLTAPMAV